MLVNHCFDADYVKNRVGVMTARDDTVTSLLPLEQAKAIDQLVKTLNNSPWSYEIHAQCEQAILKDLHYLTIIGAISWIRNKIIDNGYFGWLGLMARHFANVQCFDEFIDQVIIGRPNVYDGSIARLYWRLKADDKLATNEKWNFICAIDPKILNLEAVAITANTELVHEHGPFIKYFSQRGNCSPHLFTLFISWGLHNVFSTINLKFRTAGMLDANYRKERLSEIDITGHRDGCTEYIMCRPVIGDSEPLLTNQDYVSAEQDIAVDCEALSLIGVIANNQHSQYIKKTYGCKQEWLKSLYLTVMGISIDGKATMLELYAEIKSSLDRVRKLRSVFSSHPDLEPGTSVVTNYDLSDQEIECYLGVYARWHYKKEQNKPWKSQGLAVIVKDIIDGRDKKPVVEDDSFQLYLRVHRLFVSAEFTNSKNYEPTLLFISTRLKWIVSRDQLHLLIDRLPAATVPELQSIEKWIRLALANN